MWPKITLLEKVKKGYHDMSSEELIESMISDRTDRQKRIALIGGFAPHIAFQGKI